MKLVTQTHCLADTFGHEKAVRILAKNGYDGIDLSFFEMVGGDGGPWMKADWKEKAEALRKVADEEGIPIVQAHAPFPSSKGSEPFDSEVRRRIIRSMEVAKILGVEYIIVHPMQHLTYHTHQKETFDMNVAFYTSLIPECERIGIKVCAENMWQYDKKRGHIVDSICSQPDEFMALLDTVNSPWICGCLDLGHTALVGTEPQDFIRAMGKEHIHCLHVHDVDYKEDCHTIPFLEKLDYLEIMKAFKEIGYEGNLTFEADNFLFGMPVELREDASKMMEKVGRYLIKLFEE